MQKQTAYFSFALMLAAVVFVAGFALRPLRREPARTAASSASPAVLAPTASSTSLPSSTMALPATETPLPSPTPNPTRTRTAPAPDTLSESGAASPVVAEPSDVRSPVRSFGVPATPVLDDPAPTATASPASGAPEEARETPATMPLTPDRIVASTIGLDSKINPVGWQEVTDGEGNKSLEWVVASYAVSWHETSARLGEPGNTVLTGHNNEKGEVFRHLEHLNIGDRIQLYAGDRAFEYKVTDKFILEEKNAPYEQRLLNARWIGPFDDERITLMSCWPYTNNTHRIFVIAKPVAVS